MKFSFDIKIGQKVIRIEDEAQSQAEMFQKISPYHEMEIAAEGKDEVYISHRQNGDGDSFYALVIPSANLEFPFGVVREGGGRLFPGNYLGKGKGTKRGSFPIQYSGFEPREDRGQDQQGGNNGKGDSGKLKAPQAAPTQAETNQTRAQAHLAMGYVAHAPTGSNRARWNVGPGGKHHTVWVDAASIRQCNCPDLTKGRAADPTYECEHIIAVALWKQANQPAKV